MKNSKRKYTGFTLVELVIVIAIVIILSVVSVPIYRGYTRNAKMSEGYALLGTILSSQKSYFSQYGNFLSSSNSSAGTKWFTCNEEVFGIDARGNKYFTLFEVGSAPGEYKFNAKVVAPEELGGQTMLLMYNMTTEEKVRFSIQKNKESEDEWHKVRKKLKYEIYISKF